MCFRVCLETQQPHSQVGSSVQLKQALPQALELVLGCSANPILALETWGLR